jgi:hypothetical protein
VCIGREAEETAWDSKQFYCNCCCIQLGKGSPSLSKQNAFHKSIHGTTQIQRIVPIIKLFWSSLQQRPLTKVFFFCCGLRRHEIQGRREAKKIKKKAIDNWQVVVCWPQSWLCANRPVPYSDYNYSSNYSVEFKKKAESWTSANRTIINNLNQIPNCTASSHFGEVHCRSASQETHCF